MIRFNTALINACRWPICTYSVRTPSAVILTWEVPRNYCTVLSTPSGYCKGEGLDWYWVQYCKPLGKGLITTYDADIMIAKFQSV